MTTICFRECFVISKQRTGAKWVRIQRNNRGSLVEASAYTTSWNQSNQQTMRVLRESPYTMDVIYFQQKILCCCARVRASPARHGVGLAMRRSVLASQRLVEGSKIAFKLEGLKAAVMKEGESESVSILQNICKHFGPCCMTRNGDRADETFLCSLLQPPPSQMNVSRRCLLCSRRG